MARQHLINRHSFTKDKAVSGDTIAFGEIAVNCHKDSPKIYIKTATAGTSTDVKIESFSPDSVLDEKFKNYSQTGHTHSAYASSSHTHNASAITGGTIAIASLQTGSTTGYGITKLYNGVDSTSTTVAATANAVKTAYDKGVTTYNYLTGLTATTKSHADTASAAATSATTKATAAANSATNAASYATSATTKATNAASYATSATTMATNAASYATSATTMATNAATSASNAATAYTATVNALGNYLPKSGGTMSGAVVYSSANPAMYLLRPSGTPYMRFGNAESSGYGEIGVNSDGDLVFWSLKSDNLAYNAWNTVLHSKNSAHTHSYAGSASAGGAATSANKLNTDGGSATQPVYFSNGVPVACTYTLGKSVPSDADFTNTHHQAYLRTGSATTSTSNTTDTANGIYFNLVENSTVRSNTLVCGSTNVTVTSPTAGTIVITGPGTGSTSVYGITQLSDSINSTSSALAATPKAVNDVYKAVTATTATTKSHMDTASASATAAANSATGASASATAAAGSATSAKTHYDNAVTAATSASTCYSNAKSAMETATDASASAIAAAGSATTKANAALTYTKVITGLTNSLFKTVIAASSATALATSTTATNTSCYLNFINANDTLSKSQCVAGLGGVRVFPSGGTVVVSGASDTKVSIATSTSKSFIIGTTYSGTTTSATTATKSDIYMSGNTMHGATAYYQDSDERLKTFHGEVDVDLEKLSQLPKAYFTWNKDDSNDMQIGTSAQKVRELYPEIVSEDENGKLSVDYSKLSVIALKGVEKLYDRVKTMETDLTLIKEKLGL